MLLFSEIFDPQIIQLNMKHNISLELQLTIIFIFDNSSNSFID